MDLVFGEEGLNLDIVRYNFGGRSIDYEIDSSMLAAGSFFETIDAGIPNHLELHTFSVGMHLIALAYPSL
ncbi:hypothetical protein [Paenibacillus sinopodophylli]|uniref:hypothetical protein n=1 Tax=Paenibacillus sinopodophylli TaxID=1837342 RepID=UPI00110CBD86|nr:hypothetical protein [Paenibacillus sinopodophylli]